MSTPSYEIIIIQISNKHNRLGDILGDLICLALVFATWVLATCCLDRVCMRVALGVADATVTYSL